MTPAYSRIDALHAISQIEANSSKAKDTPYLDELDEFYKEEFQFVKTKIMDLDSTKAVLQVIQALRNARFTEKDLLKKACLTYKILTAYDQMKEPFMGENVKRWAELSDILNVLTFFDV